MRPGRPYLRYVVAPLLAVAAIVHGQTERPNITLAVDATEAPTRHLLHARETIPVGPGPLTLLYPKWIPGEHGPTGPILDVAGPKILAGNTVVPWRRDLEEMFAFH